jgi:hypothetical protein
MFFTFVTVCFAQQNDANTDEKNGGNIILKAGTQVSGQLQQTLDVEKTQSGDEFVLTLTEDISGNGVTFIKGTELMGRVVRVKTISGDDNISEISIFFDFLKNGDDYLKFKASVMSAAPEGAKPEIHFAASPVFKGATVISIKGKNLQLEEGSIFRLKLDKDLLKP